MDYNKTPTLKQSPVNDSIECAHILALAGPSVKLQEDLREVISEIPEHGDAWNCVKTYLPVATSLGVEGSGVVQTARELIAEPKGDLAHALSQDDATEAQRLLTVRNILTEDIDIPER
jgi:hypothetical protein